MAEAAAGSRPRRQAAADHPPPCSTDLACRREDCTHLVGGGGEGGGDSSGSAAVQHISRSSNAHEQARRPGLRSEEHPHKQRCRLIRRQWGIAYCVKGGPEKERKAMQYLERRECEYDQKISIDFYKEGHPLKPAVTGILVFVSTPDPIGNKYYLGSAPLQDMARQIATANGPTGYNRDYLFSMEKALASISHEDDSIIELADEVRKVLNRTKETKITGANASLKSHVPLVHLSALPEGTVVDSR